MSDQARDPRGFVGPGSSQQPGKQAPSPFAVQMMDPKFQSLSYEDQQYARADLYDKLMQKDPNWAKTPAVSQVQAFQAVREAYPPAFSDPQYEMLRQNLEDPRNGPSRFLYSMDASMGMTGLLTRGVVNAGRALGGAVTDVGQFFGINPQPNRDNRNLDLEGLMLRTMSGDRDGVKLAQYLQRKYEKPINPAIPLIGGATPTQLLGSALGFGTDLLSAKGVGAPAEAGLATAAPVAKLAGRAAITGTLGVGRGVVAGAVNAARPGVAPVEGAVDSTHGIVSTVKSVGELWGAWAAQDLAFGMLGQGAAEGVSRVGKTFFRAVGGKGTAGLPHEEMFAKTEGGQYTPEATDLQRRFLAGNLTPEARSQLGPAAADYARSYAETLDYSMQDPKALLDNPVAAWRVANQHMMEGKNTPLGIATVEDGAGTWRVRTGLGKGGEVLGEHLSFPEAEMVTHGAWNDAIATAKSNYEKWNAAYEEKGGKEDLRQMQSYQLRMNALEDAFAHDRAIRDSLTLVNGNMDRIAPEGAARKPSAGVMLTYGEVGQIQATGMKVAKTNIALSDASLEDLAKRGQLVTSDAPMRLAGVGGGDYNAAIVYAKGAPEQVYQAALARADEYIKNGANASREDLAYWTLRDKGFDAIEHADGSTTALYPRQQIKHVSDFVNKSSREYITPPEVKATVPTEGVTAPGGEAASYKAPDMLGTEGEKLDWLMEVANREANTRIMKQPDGQYQLHMFGMQQAVVGDLPTITDVFLTRSTTVSHLRASLQSEGMSLVKEGDQWSIRGRDGTTLGSGSNLAEAMVEAKYRPKLLDGRFGPASVEVMPEGFRFETGYNSVRGTLSDIAKYVNQFMDVAEEEGKTPHLMTDSGGVALGHDGAYTVEIPGWGIREKFGSAAEAKDYLNGRYKEYDNVQRLANERGFSFDYDAKRGYVLSNATGTYTAKTMDDVGKVLAKVPDPRWAPGGQFDAGTTIKDSADATRLASDVFPNNRNTGAYYDRGAMGKAISRARTFISDVLAPARSSIARAEREYGLNGLSKSFFKAGESLKTSANQTFLDAQKVLSISRLYNFSGKDTVIVDKVMQALGEEDRQKVLGDFGLREGSAKRTAILDAAQRLRGEFYNKLYTRSGQDPDIFLKDYARKVSEWKQRNPEAYRDMEMKGPDGMRKLITSVYAGRVPDGMGFQALNERVADMDGILKEQNAFSKALLYAQAANRWTYAAENMKAFAQRLHAKDVPDHIQKLGDHFIDEALNAGQSDAREILQALGKEGSTGAHRGAISYLQTAAGMGAYGFKPSSALTILQHNYLLSTGFLGTEATNAGFAASAKGGLPHLQEQFAKGVFTGRVPILYGFGDASMGSSWLANLFTKAGKASSYFVQNGHILGRSAVYDGASWLFDKHVKPWVDGGKLGDWNAKVRSIRGYYLDPGALSQVEGLLSKGDYAGAQHAYAQNMTDQVAFAFRPEDQGLALNSGMVAKMYGQLMVVPTHYAAAMTRLAGSGGFFDRVANLATFAKNTAAFYGANRAIGLSGANLLPWRVVTLRGGPLWQNLTNLTSQQPGSKTLKAAEKALASVSPGIPQVIQATQVVKELQAGKPWAAFLTANGFSVSPDLRPPKR